jgi:hypothetical protein
MYTNNVKHTVKGMERGKTKLYNMDILETSKIDFTLLLCLGLRNVLFFPAIYECTEGLRMKLDVVEWW